MPHADPSGQLLDDLRRLVEHHGADEIVLHLDPVYDGWHCTWGIDGSRFDSAVDADLTRAVRAMLERADLIDVALRPTDAAP